MKILIVSSYFPPMNSIASLRPYSWAKYWSKMGHDVTVLTTKKIRQRSDLLFDCSTFKIRELELWIPFYSYYKKEKGIISKHNKLTIKQRILILMKQGYNRFSQKTGCFYGCRYPDWHDIWAKKALKLVNNEKWDLVVSTGWPYSVHRVGLALKKKGKTKLWIVDWRDLWTKNHLYRGLKIFHIVERSLEKKFHKFADIITTVSHGSVSILKSMTNTPVYLVYNGYDPNDFAEILNKPRAINNRLEMAYTGTIYKGFRDPSPLLIAIYQLMQCNKISDKDIHISFAGTNYEHIEKLSDQLELRGICDFLGLLPRDKVLQLQYDSDILIFLDWNDIKEEGILTGKLFEYLYLGREIIIIRSSHRTEACLLIEESNAGFFR